MARFLTSLLTVFLVAYAGAMLLWLAGTFGWFGQEKDPLSAIFVVLLGWPWTKLIDILPEGLWPYAGAVAPGVNALILYNLKRFFAS